MFVEGKSRTVFFPSDTHIYDISRDGSKNYNIRTCEHMILGQDGSTSNELCTPEFINQLVGWLIPSISFTKSKSSSILALDGHHINIELPLKEKQCITFKIKVVPRW